MPLPPPPSGGRNFTGAVRLRRALFGRLVLQLEEEGDRHDRALPPTPTIWRDARAEDLWRLPQPRRCPDSAWAAPLLHVGRRDRASHHEGGVIATPAQYMAKVTLVGSSAGVVVKGAA